jgi:hypothetical protein
MENKANQPEKNFRFGGVRVTVWRDVRKGPGGKSFEARSITLDRAYKDAKGQWQNTHSMKEADVPKAVAALQKAYVYLTERETDEFAKDPDAAIEDATDEH